MIVWIAGPLRRFNRRKAIFHFLPVAITWAVVGVERRRLRSSAACPTSTPLLPPQPPPTTTTLTLRYRSLAQLAGDHRLLWGGWGQHFAALAIASANYAIMGVDKAIVTIARLSLRLPLTEPRTLISGAAASGLHSFNPRSQKRERVS